MQWNGTHFTPTNDTIATHAVAKNVIGVGGHENYKPAIADPSALADNINELYIGSGRGPTDDGRIKPDILATATEVFSTRSRIAPAFPPPPGLGQCIKNQSFAGGNYNLGPNYSTCHGTSMATPHIAGLVALLRQYFKTHEGIQNPSSALIKATLINSAVDMGYGLPSNTTGWGRVNITNVLSANASPPPVDYMRFWDVTNGLTAGSGDACVFPVAAGQQFKATLVWSDKEAAIATQKTLINDLDLMVTGPNGLVYNGNDFTAPFNNQRDNTNNVEQVIIPAPTPGEYAVSVSAFSIPSSPQPYALVLSFKDGYTPGAGPAQYPIICTRR